METEAKRGTTLAVRAEQHDVTPFEPRGMEDALHLADLLAKSNLLPSHLRGKPADVLVTLLSGRELGFSPLQSVRGIYVVEGKPTLAAEAMVALCKRRSDVCEWFRLVESTAQRCVYETQRRGEPEPTRMSFAMDDATRAGVAGKITWKSYPAAMLRARCASGLARAVYPDLLFGVYDPDEIGAPAAGAPPPKRVPGRLESETVDGEIVEPVAVEPVAVERSKAPLPSTVERVTEPPAAEADPAQQAGLAARIEAAMQAAGTLADLNAAAAVARDLPDAERSAARRTYAARKRALEAEAFGPGSEG